MLQSLCTRFFKPHLIQHVHVYSLLIDTWRKVFLQVNFLDGILHDFYESSLSTGKGYIYSDLQISEDDHALASVS
jgi:hypothetical protein